MIARAEDASKISRIVERFNLASVDTASIVTEVEKSRDAKAADGKEVTDGQPEPDIGVQEKAEKDKLLDALMGKPIQKEENAPNPSVAKTEKSPLSEPTSEQPKKSAEGATMTKDEKPSVNYQISGRELLTPDEVRLLDNRYALLFVRGERPVMDLKYDILKHPNVKLTM